MKNVLNMLREAVALRREMATLQSELEKQTVDYECGGGRVKVTACGDLTIRKIVIDPQMCDPTRVERLQELLLSGVNGALRAAKKKAERELARLTGGLGLGRTAEK